MEPIDSIPESNDHEDRPNHVKPSPSTTRKRKRSESKKPAVEQVNDDNIMDHEVELKTTEAKTSENDSHDDDYASDREENQVQLTEEQMKKLVDHSFEPYNYSGSAVHYYGRSVARTGASQRTKSHHANVVHPPKVPLGASIYGKLIPICSLEICCICNKVNKQENVLRCHGDGCFRAFHWTCYKEGTLIDGNAPNEADFMCRHCDPLDSTLSLIEYFEHCNEDRAQFDSSYAYVVHSLETQIEIREAQQESAQSGSQQVLADEQPTDVGAAGENSTTKAKARNRKQQQQRPFVKKSSIELPKSELEWIDELCHLMTEHTNNPAKPSASTSSDAAQAASEATTSQAVGQSAAAPDVPRNGVVSPAQLVGKTVRLYCPYDNVYHIGRIIDWRKARPFLSSKNEPTVPLFFGKGDIGSSEFLVRFKPGVSGRKRALHEWIVLEEHNLALGLNIVWGDRLRKGKKWWEPALTLFRSALEMTAEPPGEEEVSEPSQRVVLALFFGDDIYSFLRLKDVVDYFSPLLASARRQPTNRSIQLAVALANVEAFEQSQVLQWHRMALLSPSSSRGLSILDYDTLPPLFPDNADKLAGFTPCHYPKLCTQISRGVDRLWIADAAGMNERGSINAVEGMTIQRLTSLPSGMAQLKKQWKQDYTKE